MKLLKLEGRTSKREEAVSLNGSVYCVTMTDLGPIEVLQDVTEAEESKEEEQNG
jgi:hypothetical protein